jgi:hypothetical protein
LQGFTSVNQAGDIVPVIKPFLRVKGTFQISSKAKAQCPPTLLIHIYLESISHRAHFSITQDLLLEYYGKCDDGGLQVLELPFNITDIECSSEWTRNAGRIVTSAGGRYRNVVAFVTAHSDSERGDLWLSDDKQGNQVAVHVSHVSAELLYQFILMLNMNLTVGINHTQATRTNTTTRNSIYAELWIRVTVSRVIC